MNILYIIPYVPSLVRVRPYQFIRSMKGRGHHITLATLWTNEQEKEDLNQLAAFCDEVIAVPLPVYRSLLNCVFALPTPMPLQAKYSWNGQLWNSIRQRLSQDDSGKVIDVVHVEHLRGSQYGVGLKAAAQRGELFGSHPLPPIVWDSVDCISHLFKQAANQSKQGIKRRITQFDLHRTERREGWLAAFFDQVLVTSEKDRQALLALAAHPARPPRIEVVPNGVDVDYFQPGAFEKREKATLVVSGKMSYHANVNMVLYLVNEVMPAVWRSRPDTKVMVVGKDPAPQIMELAKRPEVNVTGTVPSVLPYLQSATAAVAPIQYGAGIQNKVLEAMACSTPVIATSIATSALSVEPGKEVLVANTPEEWAACILDIIASPEKQKKLGEAGRQFVEQNHRWTEIARRLEDIYITVSHVNHTH